MQLQKPSAERPAMVQGDVMNKRATLIGMLIIMLIAFSLPTAIFAQQIQVPNVVNLDLAQAKQAIEKAGLKFNIAANAPTADQKLNGKVASQNPAAHQMVAPGITINITGYQLRLKAVITSPQDGNAWEIGTTQTIRWTCADKSEPPFSLVLNKPDSKTNWILAEKIRCDVGSLGWTIDKSVQPGNYKINILSPSDRTFDASSNGTFAIVAPKLTTVPSILLMDPQQAAKAIQTAGLKYQTAGTTPTTEQIKNGKVASQNPAAGAAVQPGSIITANMYQYQEPLSTVPNVVKMDLEQAKLAIAKAGLTANTNASTPQNATPDQKLNGKVANQTPPGGQSVRRGSIVNLWAYRYQPPSVIIPNIIKMDPRQAASALQAVGLKYQAAGTMPTTEQIKNGKVCASTPPAGSTIQLGSTVKAFACLYEPPKAPNVLSMDQAQAIKALESAGLKYQLGGKTPTPEQIKNGKVASQNPPAGTTVQPGSTVILTTYLYLPLVAVPNVALMDRAQATKVLENAAFRCQASGTTPTTEKAKDGKVVSQNPKADQKIQKGSVVAITTYKYQGPPALVPNVVGLPREQAAKALQQSSLKANFLEGKKSPIKDRRLDGAIGGQNPAAGLKIPQGDKVDLWLYQYKQPGASEGVIVPKLVGLTSEEALKILQKAGFPVVNKPPEPAQATSQSGKIARQDPPGGTRVYKGEPVSITAYASKAAKVPSVVTRQIAQARQELGKAGFAVKINIQQTNDQAQDGKVSAQIPRAGSDAAQGATINLTVLQKGIDLPNLVGMQYKEAQQLLSILKLAQEVRYEPTNKPERNSLVLSQSPAPGTRVQISSNVKLTVAQAGTEPLAIRTTFLKDAKATLVAVSGGAPPHVVSVKFNAPTADFFQIVKLPDDPKAPGLSLFRATAKQTLSGSLVVTDSKGNKKEFAVEFRAK
jgi:beta-lactam-binding protein with PASTA domain